MYDDRSVFLLRHLPLLLLLVPLLPDFAPPAHAEPVPDAAWLGHWEGQIKYAGRITGVTLTEGVQLNIAEEKGAFRGDIYLPAWGETQWPLVDVSVERDPHRPADATLRFRLDTPTRDSGVFSGSSDGTTLQGTYTWKGHDYEVLMGRGEVVEARRPVRPQIPIAPFPYRVDRVDYRSDGAALSGLLSRPNGGGKHPAVLLLYGSGAQSCDPEVPGNPSTDPWQWVMADYLSRRGIVVLRVDDRGTGHSSGDYATSTIEALSNDALAGIQFLRSHPQVDSGRVGLLGLSEGALVAQIAAADSPSLTRHVVLLGGPGIPGDANFLEQARRLAIPTRRPQERAAEERRLVAKAWIRQLAKSDVDEEAIRAEVRAWNAGSSEPVNAKVLESMLNSALTPIVRSEIRFDPAPVLPRVKAPILALNGAADLWVNADSNLPAIRRAAEAGGNREVVVRRLEGLDHALRPAPGDKPGREEFDIDEQVLAMIAGWILDH